MSEVTVSGTLYGEPVSATRHDDGRIEGDTSLLMLTAKLAERGERVSFWPLGDTTASVTDEVRFAITCASVVEGSAIEGLDDVFTPDEDRGLVDY